MDNLEWMWWWLGVPVKIGRRITFEETRGSEPLPGVITGANGSTLSIRIDGESADRQVHAKSWRLTYVLEDASK